MAQSRTPPAREEFAISGYVGLVIAYRRPDLVAHVLAALAAQTALPSRVLVVDNGGTLDEAQLASMALADRVELVPRPDNPGYGAAVNEARERIGESALLVLTHDAAFGPTLASGLLEAMGADRRVGAAAPILHRASDPDRVFSAGGRLARGGRASHWQRPLSAKPYPVDWADGAIVMYSRAALDAIGWIAEHYFLYFEDVDAGWRMSRAGLRTVVVPGERALQEPGEHPQYLGIRNMTLFARDAGIPAWRFLPSLALRVGREALGRLRRGKAPALAQAWRGWRDGRAGMSGKPA